MIEQANQEVTGIAQCRQCKINIKFGLMSVTNRRDHAKTQSKMEIF